MKNEEKIVGALQKATDTKRNLLIVGPPVGKTTTIETWAKKNGINIYRVYPYNRVCRNSNTDKGILLFDDISGITSEDTIPQYIKEMGDDVNAFVAERLDNAQIISVVIVLSEHDKLNKKSNAATVNIIKEKVNWDALEVKYDKREHFEKWIELYRNELNCCDEDKKEDYEFAIGLCEYLINSDSYQPSYSEGTAMNTRSYRSFIHVSERMKMGISKEYLNTFCSNRNRASELLLKEINEYASSIGLNDKDR